MRLRANSLSVRRRPVNGFSLMELLLSLAVLLVMTTIAVPVVLRSLQIYQLNSAASQLSGMLKLTKFEAIRRNTPVSCQIVQQGSNWLVWVDLNGNNVADGPEPEMIVGGTFTLLPAASVPDPSPIAQTLGPGGKSILWTVVPESVGTITYDQRGVSVKDDGTGKMINASTVYVLYLGSATNPNMGFRAVVRLPSGAVQVWTSPSAGTWLRVS